MSLTSLPAWLGQELASLNLQLMLVLFVLALVISAVGFYRVVYFISIGYAFSIVAMAVTVIVVLRQNLTAAAALQNLLLAFWGLRLGIFLVRRELQPSFSKEIAATHERNAGTPFYVKVLIWITVSLLYVLMFSPSLFVMTTPAAERPSAPASLIQWLGLAIMIAALIMESLADRQKSAFKARYPSQFCDTGLYRWVRCPNYLGEILFWTGNWVAGLLFYATALRWLASLIGLVCIVLIMLGSTKRLEEQQNQRYGDRPEYQEYVRSVPILIPYLPVFTFRNLRVYLG
ncbi:MAG: DUF1295 domain-containing protein [Caldilineales bacterium]